MSTARELMQRLEGAEGTTPATLVKLTMDAIDQVRRLEVELEDRKKDDYLGFMRHLRDHNRKPGVLAEHEMLEVIRDYLTNASLKS
jgi:hypothetical protein